MRFEQVRRYTTTRPKTQAGVDLYALAKGLLVVGTSEEAAAWLASYAMPTDDDIAREMRAIGYEDRAKTEPRKWGDELV